MIPVDVYRNLHTGGFSVRNRRTGRVMVSDAAYVLVKDARFVVQKRGNEIAKECNEKTVHAFVRGNLGSFNYQRAYGEGCHPVTYNPKRHSSFVLKGDEDTSIEAAPYAECIAVDGGSCTVYVPCTDARPERCLFEMEK